MTPRRADAPGLSVTILLAWGLFELVEKPIQGRFVVCRRAQLDSKGQPYARYFRMQRPMCASRPAWLPSSGELIKVEELNADFRDRSHRDRRPPCGGTAVDGGRGRAGIDQTARKRRVPAVVEVVGGDLEKPESLASAFDGVDRMYLLATGDTQQVVDLAKRAGVRRVVVLSSASAGFQSDPGGEFHRATERVVENSGLEWTHVRPGMFAGNLLDWADAIRVEGVVKAPYGAARQSPVHERN